MGPTISLDNGLTVPRLGFGTFELDGEDAYRSTRTALEVGYRHVDTAQGYDNEEEVGRAIADSEVDRGDVWLTTKIKPSNAKPEDVRASSEQSLRKLGVEQVDLILLHWPAEHVAPLEATLEAMTALVDDGLTRSIGVSNFPSRLLARAYELSPGIITDQVEHHPYLGVDAIERVLEEHGGFLTAYSPLARGNVSDDATLTEIGEAHGVSAAQVTLRWMLQKPDTVAIPKSGNPDRIRTNFAVFDFELDDDELQRIGELERQERLIDPEGGPDWD
ncbi:aldo/keto reductase [Egicoccus halophilus]|uniref:2,5-didehydrogluconate reductase n=1 Tax=Egicoccus halophilus TaxID=1670830 RepID=A0A8J3A8M2_9ACTN|nr:aldo/keto reductase [Egicoccus halophilus]GGI07047.1 2,5-didehydrogluconate reductase [Egicoccus halophilus]